jgi:Tfp pilus assembly protein PilF
MNKYLFFSMLFWLLRTFSFAQPTVHSPNDAPKTYAVIVGIAAYENAGIPALEFSEQDARLFADYLASAAGGSVPVQNRKLLLGRKATIANIYEALNWLNTVCKEGDRAFFYFSGHGDVETNDQQNAGYLLAWNSPENNYRNNAVRIEDLNNYALQLSQSKKAKVILITDACRSGSLAGDLFNGKQLVAKRLGLSRAGEARLASCGPDELAAESAEWDGGRGIFSYYLLHGLTGMADRKTDGRIEMEELTAYLDSCFKADKVLKAENHKQTPVLLGSPVFDLAKVDAKTLGALKQKIATNPRNNIDKGIWESEKVPVQPIDYFFDMFDTLTIEHFIDAKQFSTGIFPEVQMAVIDSCKRYYASNYFASWETSFDSAENWSENYIGPDTLMLDSLKGQLMRFKLLQTRFNERLGLLIHSKAQQMVNAYLEGDLGELNRRQYYYKGKQNYDDFIPLVKLAISYCNKQPNVERLLKLQYAYLSGLNARTKLLLSPDRETVIKTAFKYQREAIAIDPFAAYIHNELGILHLRQRRFDSAQVAFRRAMQIAPTWALPWSNMISLHLGKGELDKAKEAARKVKTLQSNLPYAMVNEALVWEQEKNYLEAEPLYLKAIQLNNVHFFPYEKLGQLYIQTGDYHRADSFLYEAGLRKQDYAIQDDNFFWLGMEAGGAPSGDLAEVTEDAQGMAEPGTPAAFIALNDGVRALRAGMPVKADSLLKKALKLRPEIPLAHHYLGMAFAKQHRWKEAADAFDKAAHRYYFDEALEQFFGYQRPAIDEAPAEPDTTTIFIRELVTFQYDILEDYFWLGKMHEALGDPVRALEAYTSAASIERERAFARAAFDDKEQIWKMFNSQDHFFGAGASSDISHITESPVPMVAAFKIAELYEKSEDWYKAEETLIHQITYTRYLGQVRYHRENFNFKDNFPYRVFTLRVCADAEAALINFYTRMMAMQPASAYWHKKAGWFYYERFSYVFNRYDPVVFPDLYKKVLQFPFPWVGTHWSEGETWDGDKEKQLVVPGTKDTMVLSLPKYDPLLRGITLLQRSMQLSGNVVPDAKSMYAMAEMNTWAVREEDAQLLYEAYFQQEPDNAGARKRYMDYLFALRRYPQAFEQMQVLYRQQQLDAGEYLDFAYYATCKGDYVLANKVLEDKRWVGNIDEMELNYVKGILHTLQGNYKKAGEYLSEMPVETIMFASVEGEQESAINDQEAKRRYTLARVYALAGEKEKAFTTLKLALDAGFLYTNVVKNDPATKALRSKPEWNKMMNNYEWKEIVDNENFNKGLMMGDHKYLYPFNYKLLPPIYRE